MAVQRAHWSEQALDLATGCNIIGKLESEPGCVEAMRASGASVFACTGRRRRRRPRVFVAVP